jgi:hypothetical protein
MQRLHMDDLTGFIQSLSDGWTVLSLPAIAEIDGDIPISEHEDFQAAGDRQGERQQGPRGQWALITEYVELEERGEG